MQTMGHSGGTFSLRRTISLIGMPLKPLCYLTKTLKANGNAFWLKQIETGFTTSWTETLDVSCWRGNMRNRHGPKGLTTAVAP